LDINALKLNDDSFADSVKLFCSFKNEPLFNLLNVDSIQNFVEALHEFFLLKCGCGKKYSVKQNH